MKNFDLVLRFLVPAYDAVYNIIRHPGLLKKNSFIAEIFYRYIPTTLFFVWFFSLFPYEVGTIIYAILMLFGAYRVHMLSKKNSKNLNTLYYLIVLYIGFFGIRAFIGHTFFRDWVAESIGWEIGSPFQIELAFYHLGLAVSAFIFMWKKSTDLALGLVVSKSIFWFGAFGVHVYELISNGNISANNIGPWIIYMDLIIPVLLIWFLIKAREESRLN